MGEKEQAAIIKRALNRRKPLEIEDRSARFRRAAVLIPLFRSNGELKVLLTKRTCNVAAHKGQISFPGGEADENDLSLEETALREAQEEVGIRREDVVILGRTDDAYTSASNFIIRPFVGLIPHPYEFKVNRLEVSRLIEAPLQLFLEERRPKERIVEIEFEGSIYRGPAYKYGKDVIWGATARILEDFAEILDGKLDLPEPDD